MTESIRVGLLDSGISQDLASHVVAGRAFSLDDGEVRITAAAPDRIGHGTALARIIMAGAPGVALLNAQVFRASMATTPVAVAAGLDWLVAEGARVINMSFGLRHDRDVLREACAAAVDRGAILLAAAPARGPMVFPAGYEGVITVQGDARCAVGEISALGSPQADFGAHPGPLDGPAEKQAQGGASFAVAHLCAVLAGCLAEDAALDPVERLTALARYHGPERRAADG